MKTKLILGVILTVVILAVIILSINPATFPISSSDTPAASGNLTKTESKTDPNDEDPVSTEEKNTTEVEKPSAEAPVVENEISSYSGLISELDRLRQCGAGKVDCDLPQTDPRSAELELGQRFAKTIDRLTMLSQAGMGNPETYNLIAQDFVKHPDGHVQEAALELMATLNPNPQQVAALLEGLQNTHDANIYRMALLEFTRHPEPALRKEVDTFLQQTLKTGGHFASQEVAKEILPLLNQNNIEAYRKLANDLPANTRKAKDLKANIEEYERMQSGG